MQGTRWLGGWLILAAVAFGTGSGGARAQEPAGLFPFPMPWDDASATLVDCSELNHKPAGAFGFIEARDGHLYAGPERLRIFGMNLCFSACFPEHDEADQVAARMAKFGINGIRFHHMDTSPSPRGLLQADRLTIDPAQLEKLDYLIAQLKKHGIYANLNLHVGRTYPGFPAGENDPRYHKGVDNYMPGMITLQKQYARDLLTHVNPYTGTRYADEPAVAIVEINNENGLIREWFPGSLDRMDTVFVEEFQKQWNAWLATKYASTEALVAAWRDGEQPIDVAMLDARDFDAGKTPWQLNTTGGAQAEARSGSSSLVIETRKVGEQSWHVQLNWPGLAFEEGKSYTLRFRARANEPARIDVAAMRNANPYTRLWSANLDVTPQWRDFEYVFVPAATEATARLTFGGMGQRVGSVELDSIFLAPGGVLALKGDERLGSVAIIRKEQLGLRTSAAQRDWVQFLYDTEERYWTGMSDYLKKELGVKAVVVGTQMYWSPGLIQAKLDAVDCHGYWQHPRFPVIRWDRENWLVSNVSMAGADNGGALGKVALGRVLGKPYLVSEYNHPAPITYSGETMLLLSAFAARQDWDGFFAFNYQSGDDWEAGYVSGFFEIAQHPTKMATMAAAALLFRRGDLEPFSTHAVAQPQAMDWIDATRRAGATLGADAFGVAVDSPLTAYTATQIPAITASKPALAQTTEARAFQWNTADRTMVVDTPRTKIVVGPIASGPFALDEVTIAPRPNSQDWAAISVTAMSGRAVTAPGRVLITAVGSSENTGQKWKDDSHTSVGRNWGGPPALVEGIPAVITLDKVPAGRVRAWALDERGERGQPIGVEAAGAGASIALSPRFKTLWYEVEIAP